MTRLLRRDGGRPLREAMKARKMGAPAIAAATRRVDPEGRGISPAAVGRVTGTGATAQEQCRLRTAWLIADALEQPLQQLFSMPRVSTSTVERSTPDGHSIDR